MVESSLRFQEEVESLFLKPTNHKIGDVFRFNYSQIENNEDFLTKLNIKVNFYYEKDNLKKLKGFLDVMHQFYEKVV